MAGREIYSIGVVGKSPLMEEFLIAMGYSDSEEKRILKEVCSRSFRIPRAQGAHLQRVLRVSRRMRCFFGSGEVA